VEETCWSGDLRRRWEFGGDIFLKIPTRSFDDGFCNDGERGCWGVFRMGG